MFSCTDKNKIPSDILPRQKMEAVLWDMLRAGGFLEAYVFSRDTAVDKVAESQKWYDKIYQLHGITKEQFKKSFAYYKDNLQALKPILDSLSKKEVKNPQPAQAAIDTTSTPPAADTGLLKRKDSLLKINRKNKLRSVVNPTAN